MTDMRLLEWIIRYGNRSIARWRDGEDLIAGEDLITCADGFTARVIAGEGAFCVPPERGPFTHVEVYFPSLRPEPWELWAEYAEDPDRPTGTFYGPVPVALVRELIAAHGGEAS